MERGNARFSFLLSFTIISYFIGAGLVLTATLSSSFAAFPPHEKAQNYKAKEEALNEWNHFKQKFGHKWQIQWDSSDVLPRSILGKGDRIRGKHFDAEKKRQGFPGSA